MNYVHVISCNLQRYVTMKFEHNEHLRELSREYFWCTNNNSVISSSVQLTNSSEFGLWLCKFMQHFQLQTFSFHIRGRSVRFKMHDNRGRTPSRKRYVVQVKCCIHCFKYLRCFLSCNQALSFRVKYSWWSLTERERGKRMSSLLTTADLICTMMGPWSPVTVQIFCKF